MEIENISCSKCGKNKFELLKEVNNCFGIIKYLKCSNNNCNNKFKIQIYQTKTFNNV
jgi:hypothetical protein